MNTDADRLVDPAGISYSSDLDALVLRLFHGLAWPEEKEDNTWGNGVDEPKVTLVEGRSGRLLMIVIRQAARWVPAAVVRSLDKQSADLLGMPVDTNDDAIALPLFDGAFEVGRKLKAIDRDGDEEPIIDLMMARSGRVVGVVVYRASRRLGEELSS